jgi:hypothetical protein
MMNNKPPLLFALFTASDEQGGGSTGTMARAQPTTMPNRANIGF